VIDGTEGSMRCLKIIVPFDVSAVVVVVVVVVVCVLCGFLLLSGHISYKLLTKI
jgi:hypothetical protein